MGLRREAHISRRYPGSFFTPPNIGPGVSGHLLRTRDVAELLDVSCETVLRWHRSGRLRGGHRLNGSNVLRFDRDELDAWLNGTRTQLASVASGSYDRGYA